MFILFHPAHKYLPTLENNLTTPDGEPGWICDFYNHNDLGEPTGSPIATFILHDTRIKLNDFLPPGLTPTWTIKLHGDLKVEKSAEYELGLTVAGRAKLWVDEKMTIDNWTKQRPGEFFYGYVPHDVFSKFYWRVESVSFCRQGTVEERATVTLDADKPVKILVEYTNTKPPQGPEADLSQPALMRGVVCYSFLSTLR